MQVALAASIPTVHRAVHRGGGVGGGGVKDVHFLTSYISPLRLTSMHILVVIVLPTCGLQSRSPLIVRKLSTFFELVLACSLAVADAHNNCPSAHHYQHRHPLSPDSLLFLKEQQWDPKRNISSTTSQTHRL